MDAFLQKISSQKRSKSRSPGREVDAALQSKDGRMLGVAVDLHGSKNQNKDRLCASCRSLVIVATTTRMEIGKSSALSRHSVSREELVASKCRLCRFIGSLKIESGPSWGGRIKPQSIYSLNPNFADYDHLKSSALLIFQTEYQPHVFTGDGTFGLLHPKFADDDIKPRHVEPLVIESNIIREWLRFCKESHLVTCRPVLGENVPGFKVLDCLTRHVIQPERGCSYVALSYVWGAVSVPEHAQDSFPRTIEDSIRVTLDLGFRYLWIDKYCIDQSNESQKHHQIQNMDKIYSMADLTIVAAAGQDPHYGLPGVTTRTRQRQKHIALEDLELIQIYNDIQDLRVSPWARRAWTLQEGYLSKRRLIFTDKEVSFLCENMYCQESVAQKPHHRSQASWDGQDGSHLFGVIPNRNREHFNVDQILTEYNRRTLSFDADALNACLGILKAAQVSHWFGMPIERSASSMQLTLSLQWRNEKYGPRRPDFPTWSWASINSAKLFPEARRVDADYCTISVPMENDQWLTVDEWMQYGGDTALLRHSPCLRITAYIGRPLFVDGQWISQHKYKEMSQYPYKDYTPDYEPNVVGTDPWAIFSTSPVKLLPKRQKARENQKPERSRENRDWKKKPRKLTPDQGIEHMRTVFRVRLDIKTKDPGSILSDVVAMLLQPGSSAAPRTYAVMLLLKPCGDCYRRVGITDWNHEWYMQKFGEDFLFTSEKRALEDYFEKRTLYVE